MNNPLRILVIDDNPDDRTLALRQLHKEFPDLQAEEVVEAKGLARALEAGGFDLVITDYQLRWTDGLEILRAVKARWPDCPVIMFTGTGSEEIAVEAMKSGLDDYVLKSPKHLVRLVGAVPSVLQRASQRRALKEAETRYRDLFDGLPIGLYRSTPGGRILDTNPALVDLMGYPDRQALMAVHAADLYVDPEVRERWKARMEAEGAMRDFETQFRRGDGTIIWVQFSARAVRGGDGRILYYDGAIEDITQRKRSEEAVRKSGERYRTLFEQASDAIFVRDEEDRLIDCNQHACELLGYTREELLEKWLADVVAPEFMPVNRQRILEVREKGFTTFESVNLRKDGSPVDVEVSAGFIEIEGQECVMALLRDITERKRAEKALRETQAQLLRSERLASVGTLVAGVAHEILNPVNILSLHLQMLDQDIGTGDAEKLRDTYGIMKTQLDRLTGITQNLLTFARDRKPEVKVLDVRILLDEVMKLVEYQYRVENVELVRDYEENTPPIQGDEDQLAQVFLNLLTNARDAMPEGGRITVRLGSFLRAGAPWVRIAVEDSGEGIPQEMLDRIFDPFFTTKPEGKGTGLGLSISYGIIENHEGMLGVESEEGKGATFLVDLPAERK